MPYFQVPCMGHSTTEIQKQVNIVDYVKAMASFKMGLKYLQTLKINRNVD